MQRNLIWRILLRNSNNKKQLPGQFILACTIRQFCQKLGFQQKAKIFQIMNFIYFDVLSIPFTQMHLEY
jgi:hypothetical protein